MQTEKQPVDLTDLAIGIAVLGVVTSVSKKSLTNFSRLKIVDVVARSKKPLSLMELSRRTGFSKTNVEHHIEILSEAEILYIGKSRETQHNPLLITLNKIIRNKIAPEIWDKFKIYAIQKKIDMSELLEKMIEKELKKCEI